MDERARRLLDRAAFAHRSAQSLPSLDDESLLARAEEWLAPQIAGKRRLSDISPDALLTSLEGLIGYQALRSLDREAPAEFVSPAGSHHPIDYAASAGPTVEVRAQALFGLAQHPKVAGKPLVLSITSPAGRPIQTTTDLPGFWAGSWRDVVKDMRGRYPKHAWPDDAASAAPTLRTKRAS